MQWMCYVWSCISPVVSSVCVLDMNTKLGVSALIWILGCLWPQVSPCPQSYSLTLRECVAEPARFALLALSNLLLSARFYCNILCLCSVSALWAEEIASGPPCHGFIVPLCCWVTLSVSFALNRYGHLWSEAVSYAPGVCSQLRLQNPVVHMTWELKVSPLLISSTVFCDVVGVGASWGIFIACCLCCLSNMSCLIIVKWLFISSIFYILTFSQVALLFELHHDMLALSFNISQTLENTKFNACDLSLLIL